MIEMTESDELRIADNADAQRYEAHLGDRLAGFSQYHLRPGRVVFYHTVVAPEFEGHGVGSRLVRFELDDVRARGLLVTPLCPFVRAWIGRHAEYADLVEPEPAAG